MSQDLRQDSHPASTETGLHEKGLSKGTVGVLGLVVIGISSIAPAYTLTAGLGATVAEVGTSLPAILLAGFLPMLLVALGYRELNNAMPDSGTSFTWATRAFGPMIGWMGGWGLVSATVIVLSNLAAVAVDFFYILLAQLTGHDEIAELTTNLWINIPTTLVFIAIAAFISYRGMNATKVFQYGLVAFQIAVLLLFAIMSFTSNQPFDRTPITLEMFNPAGVESFSAFAAGISLSIFVFWGWDVTLTMNEETTDPKKVPGRGATWTVLLIMALYVAVSLGVLYWAGVGTTGMGAGNPENQESIFAVLSGPVMGPLALLMSLAILSSSAASLQSTMVSPARTLLAMGYYKALPTSFAKISPRFMSPSVATFATAAAAALFYVVTRLVSENALWDTITALGLMICFYYGLTALACVWYFRAELFSNARNVIFKFLAPLIGGLVLLVLFFATAIESMDPDYGSGSSIGGVGMVFILGVGVLLLGVVVMIYMRIKQPAFFKGETIKTYQPIK
ncbi:APC family permease [Glutamicibacter sp. JC586]|uniref:APC family permease n=1 Tax=Glutamicibacter sp. JC586 TaxID=2590552 RepID=UPI001356FF48|nr:APC family permease [Glutamicibacter sp. JC586]